MNYDWVSNEVLNEFIFYLGSNIPTQDISFRNKTQN